MLAPDGIKNAVLRQVWHVVQRHRLSMHSTCVVCCVEPTKHDGRFGRCAVDADKHSDVWLRIVCTLEVVSLGCPRAWLSLLVAGKS